MRFSTSARVPTASLLAILSSMVFGTAVFAAMPQYQRSVLPNDLVLLVSEEHSLPMVSVYLLLDAGAWRDPQGRQGLANLTVNALRLGTESHSGAEISEILDFNGAELTSICGRDFAVLGFHTLRRSFETVFGLFQEMIMQPAFAKQEIERKIAEIRADIQAEQDQPGIIAQKTFRKALFKDSPYGHPLEGTQNTLADMSRQDVVEFHRKFYRPNSGILAVVGDIDPQTVRTVIEAPLAAWTKAQTASRTFKSEFAVGPRIIKNRRPIDQAHIVLGHQGIARSNKDYYAVSVLNQILGGGGFGSRLMNKIRVQEGLAYSVRSVFNAHKQRGSVMVVLQTKNSTAAKAVQLALGEMQKIRKEGVTEAELSTAKKYLIGNFPVQMATRDEFARFIVQVEYYHLGKDYLDRYASYIDSVTRQDVHRAAEAYLHPKRCLLSIVADFDKIDLTEKLPL